jgi:hypothetical protein
MSRCIHFLIDRRVPNWAFFPLATTHGAGAGDGTLPRKPGFRLPLILQAIVAFFRDEHTSNVLK